MLLEDQRRIVDIADRNFVPLSVTIPRTRRVNGVLRLFVNDFCHFTTTTQIFMHHACADPDIFLGGGGGGGGPHRKRTRLII